jgi:hypothetical protein
MNHTQCHAPGRSNNRTHESDAIGHATTVMPYGQVESQDPCVGKQDKGTHGCCIWNYYYCCNSNNGTGKVETESEKERERARGTTERQSSIILLWISQSEEVYLMPADSINVNNGLNARIGPTRDRRYHARLAHASTVRFS